MIYIKRPAAPTFLTAITGIWQQETQAAILHYQVPGQMLKFNFQHYNDPHVKDALKLIFVKCAYCDSKYAHVYDGDVEHFRPKGKVKEKVPQTPGYYWLCNEWTNLLLSCQHCNQARRQIIDGETDVETLGKLDQFPLKNNAPHVTVPGASLNAENRAALLLNPCKDKPEKHLSYKMKDGSIYYLTEKGEASIKVYVLRRKALVDCRYERQMEILHQMQVAKRELDRYNTEPTPANKKIRDLELKYLIRFTKKDKPYAGMARFFVSKFLSENKLI